ncbi:unnamed protein product [Ectocarpus sp. 4 AP-2014]
MSTRLRRSFLVLAMARTLSLARLTNATIAWTLKPRQLLDCGNMLGALQQASRPPLAKPSSSPSMNRSPSRSPTSSKRLHGTAADVFGRMGWSGSKGRATLFVGRMPFTSLATRDGRGVRSIAEHIVVVRRSVDRQGVVTMAQPRKKLPERSVNVFCQKCRTQLYKYKKGGKGSLVKCYKERIVEDFTDGKLECPNCGQLFARDTMVHGRPAFKMIGGKVYQKK